MHRALRVAKKELESIRQDHTSGSAQLAVRAAGLLERFLRRSSRLSERELRHRLEELAPGLLAAQPSMAPIINLANIVLLASESASPGLAARAYREIRAFRHGLERMPREIAGRFLRRVPGGSTILTYTYSSTVLHALLAAHRARKNIRVICSESRPMLEGRRLAMRLAQAGVPVTFAVDALLPALVAEADLVVCGADAVFADGFVNKVGTRVLLRAAEEARVPFYLLVDRTKFLSPKLARWHRVRQEARQEVWRRPPRGASVLNRYFEIVPWEPAPRILTERGLLTVVHLRRVLERLPVAKQLAR